MAEVFLKIVFGTA